MTASPDTEHVKGLFSAAIEAIRNGDVDGYNKKITEVQTATGPTWAVPDEETAVLATSVQAAANVFKIERQTVDYVKTLLSCQQPQKALSILDWGVPVGLENSKALGELRAKVRAGLAHTESFRKYLELYDVEIVPGVVDISVETIRGRAAIEMFKTLPPNPRVLAIGPYEGRLERLLLESRPDAKVTMCELGSNFGTIFLEQFQADFPGRVTRRKMTDFYDWGTPDDVGSYDLIMMFEVLEHLPSDQGGLFHLNKLVEKHGVVMISVPVGHKYIEPERINDEKYGHVRAYSEFTLRGVLEDYFDEVVIAEGSDRTYVATCRKPL